MSSYIFYFYLHQNIWIYIHLAQYVKIFGYIYTLGSTLQNEDNSSNDCHNKHKLVQAQTCKNMK